MQQMLGTIAAATVPLCWPGACGHEAWTSFSLLAASLLAAFLLAAFFFDAFFLATAVLVFWLAVRSRCPAWGRL